MKNILIKQKGGVDLHSIKIRDAHEERVAIIELQKQIRGWISDMNFYKRSFFEILSAGFPVFNMELHNVPFRTSWTLLV